MSYTIYTNKRGTDSLLLILLHTHTHRERGINTQRPSDLNHKTFSQKLQVRKWLMSHDNTAKQFNIIILVVLVVVHRHRCHVSGIQFFCFLFFYFVCFWFGCCCCCCHRHQSSVVIVVTFHMTRIMLHHRTPVQNIKCIYFTGAR